MVEPGATQIDLRFTVNAYGIPTGISSAVVAGTVTLQGASR